MAKRPAYDTSTATGQKRLMAESMGRIADADIAASAAKAAARPTADYGADPLGDGLFRMVPSGDVVDYTERCRRLPRATIR